MADESWGTVGHFKLGTDMPGAKLIIARFYTNNTSDPAEVSDPSGMLTIARIGVGVYQVDLPDKYTKVHAMADYQGGVPVLWARVTTLKQANDTPNGFRVRMETSGGTATETADKPVQLLISLTNQAGRVDTET